MRFESSSAYLFSAMIVHRKRMGKNVFPAKTMTLTTTSRKGATPRNEGRSPIPAFVKAMIAVKNEKATGSAA